jgi:hypothetical protein
VLRRLEQTRIAKFREDYESRIAQVPIWLTALSPKSLWALEASLGCSIVADGAIAASLGLMLRRKLADFEHMQSVMHRLVGYAIGTGMLLVIVSLMALIAVSS